ncbi:MAG: hypothetical protein E6Q34_05570 [Burkholderiaceae bacterium]|nr:MAG: hypothetical protein E6Q34_05570 [Burkholderiaceae bacterium]
MSQSSLVAELFAAFAPDTSATPSVTLRGGNQLDDYAQPSPFDPAVDSISDAYLEAYPWGVAYLDASSWRHYLPYLIEYVIRHMKDGDLVVDALLSSLRPPDRVPPRLASLTAAQQALVTQFLESMAFDEQSSYQELACQVLDEWWLPGARYRVVAK